MLREKRADYGEQIVETLATNLTAQYGRGFDRRNLFHMIRFAEIFPDEAIVNALRTQLSWTHFLKTVPLPRGRKHSSDTKRGASNMSDIPELIGEYCAIVEQERKLDERKQDLRRRILQVLVAGNLKQSRSEHGSAERKTRFTLRPIRAEVLGLLDRDDLFPFAHFTGPKVKTLLVPRYGRERLLPLFEIHRTEYLVVKRPESGR